MKAFVEALFNDIRKDPKITDPGLTSYFDLLEVLESRRFALRTFDDVVFLLESCWLKSKDQQVRFRELIMWRRDAVSELATAFLENLATAVNTTGELPAVVAPVRQPEATATDAGTQAAAVETPGSPEFMETAAEEEFGRYHFVLGAPNEKKTVDRDGLVRGASLPAAGKPTFLFTNDYLPVKNRQLRQAWRTLQSDAQGGNTDRVDVVKTVQFSAKQGFFSDFLYHKKNVNQLNLFLFIDIGSDMLAEEEMGEELLRTAKDSYIGSAVKPCYFQNTPAHDEEKKDLCFTNKNGLDRVFLKKLCFGIPKRNATALVFSEAGAFRNEDDAVKLADTAKFVDALHRHMRSVIWINPAPKSRWTNDVCRYLSGQVSLFDSSRTDVEKAIASLKGKQVLKTIIAHAAR